MGNSVGGGEVVGRLEKNPVPVLAGGGDTTLDLETLVSLVGCLATGDVALLLLTPLVSTAPGDRARLGGT